MVLINRSCGGSSQWLRKPADMRQGWYRHSFRLHGTGGQPYFAAYCMRIFTGHQTWRQAEPPGNAFMSGSGGFAPCAGSAIRRRRQRNNAVEQLPRVKGSQHSVGANLFCAVVWVIYDRRVVYLLWFLSNAYHWSVMSCILSANLDRKRAALGSVPGQDNITS
jgi:hypothetical protein